jgi:hypothetical protein
MYRGAMTTVSAILSKLTMDEVVRVSSPPGDCRTGRVGKPLRVDGPVTLMTVPFGHRFRRLPDGWRIREWTYQPTLVPFFLGAVPGLGTCVLLVYDAWDERILTSSIEHMLGAVFFLAGGLVCLLMSLVWLGRYRRLRFDAEHGTFRLSYGNVVTRANMEVTVPFGQVVLAIHEVKTFSTRASMKERKSGWKGWGLGWKGWGLGLHLGQEVFLLACHRKREDLLEFVSHSPAPLNQMPVVDGSRIEGLAYR